MNLRRERDGIKTWRLKQRKLTENREGSFCLINCSSWACISDEVLHRLYSTMIRQLVWQPDEDISVVICARPLGEFVHCKRLISKIDGNQHCPALEQHISTGSTGYFAKHDCITRSYPNLTPSMFKTDNDRNWLFKITDPIYWKIAAKF